MPETISSEIGRVSDSRLSSRIQHPSLPSQSTSISNGLPSQSTASEAQVHIRNLMVDADEEEDVRIHLAALGGDAEGLQALLSQGECKLWLNFRVRPFLATPLRLAVTGGSTECVHLLIESDSVGVDLEDIKAQTPLFIATSLRNLSIMEILLKNGANPSGNPNNLSPPILLAVRDGFAEGVKLLLKFGANEDPTKDAMNRALRVSGWPLQHSIVYAHFSCFLALIQNGASSNIRHLADQLPTLQRLSIPHSIAKYAGNYPEFVRLFYDIGGDLRQCGIKGTSVIEENVDPHHDSLALREIRRLTGNPLPLKAQCRLKIRLVLGRKRLILLETLQDIPTTVKEYLQLREYEKFAQHTKENLHVKIRTIDDDST